MAADPSPPGRHCDACGLGHSVAVPYCPFCGAAQRARADTRNRAPGETNEIAGPDQATLAFGPVPQPSAAADRSSHRPLPARRAFHSPAPKVRADAPPHHRPRLRHVGLTVLFVAGLTCLAPGLPDGIGPTTMTPTQLAIGPAWTPVTLAPFRAAPRMSVRGGGTFHLRVDGDRVVRVVPGDGITIGTALLRSLEVRAAHPTLVTLTPQRD